MLTEDAKGLCLGFTYAEVEYISNRHIGGQTHFYQIFYVTNRYAISKCLISGNWNRKPLSMSKLQRKFPKPGDDNLTALRCAT